MAETVKVLVEALAGPQPETAARRLWVLSWRRRPAALLQEHVPAMQRFVEPALSAPTGDLGAAFFVSGALRHLAAHAGAPLPPLVSDRPSLGRGGKGAQHLSMAWTGPGPGAGAGGEPWFIDCCPVCASSDLEVLSLDRYGDLTGRQETALVKCRDCGAYTESYEDR